MRLRQQQKVRIWHNPDLRSGLRSGRYRVITGPSAPSGQHRAGEATVHGFRSCFTDWATEQTNFPSEVREMALAHAVGDKVEAAYRRGDLFEKRRALAEAWAQYCDGEEPAESKVVRFAGRAG